MPSRRHPTLTGPGSFHFLGAAGSLDIDGWDNPLRAKLWRYNQHYFDDLNAHDAAARADWQQALVRLWIAGNPPPRGSGWEPYPTSLRIVNWVKWMNGGARAPEGMIHSLAVQARWLMRNLEWHLLGNHLFANAKALVFAGCTFDGPEAMRWLRQGVRILINEIPEQILPDGGHFELTPLYHALALEDVLDLVNILKRSGCAPDLLEVLRARVEPMQDWLAAVSHPDGGISFFNDAAFGIAPETPELTAYARRLDFNPPRHPDNALLLPDSGYARLATDQAVVIADLAKIGPSYLPGHAHADTLSFEMSIFGQRVIVNSGTSEYGLGVERLRQRGTAAHSTVTVANENSSEVWAGFRVARRAYVHDVIVEAGLAKARHDGYRRLHPAVDHHRQWNLGEMQLVVTDRVAPAVKSLAYYHLHPNVDITVESPLDGTLNLPNGQRLRWKASGAAARVKTGTWHPRFGASVATSVLVLALDEDGVAALTLTWSDTGQEIGTKIGE
jgi:uncharacterized heparinase superfamily protein